jgi:adenylate cyclase class IV
MQYEVEQKHRIDDVAALVAMLEERGVKLGSPVEQIDQYFAHPAEIRR